MKHVCVDARLYFASGIGTYLQTAIPALAQSSLFKLSLLCREQDREKLSDYSSHLVTMKSWIYSFKEQAEYRKIPKCDLFWSPHFNVPLVPIRAKKRLTTICDVFHLAHFSTLSLLQKGYAKLMYRAACSLSDSVTTLSEFSKSEILKHISIQPEKLTVLSTPFYFSRTTKQVSEKSFLLCVGNVKPHKNLVRLVQAYAQLQPEESLYIVGKKEGLVTRDSKLFQEVEQNPFLKKNVYFTGYVSDEKLKEMYAQAKLFIFPSTYEGYGYPPLEAMACECPVIASKVASIPEVCADAVEYIDPLSVESIASGMQKLLKDSLRREELVQKGKELVEKMKNKQNQIVDIIDACCCHT